MVQQGKHKIKIEAKTDGRARIVLDGKDVSNDCVGYSIEHEAGSYAVVELRYRFFGSVELSGTVEMLPMVAVYSPPQEGKS